MSQLTLLRLFDAQLHVAAANDWPLERLLAIIPQDTDPGGHRD